MWHFIKLFVYTICIYIGLCGLVQKGQAVADTLNIRWLNEDYTDYDMTTCTVGGTLTLPTNPTKRGYTFTGWEKLLTPIEYIESTGAQWIDTGIVANVDTHIVSDEAIINNTGSVVGCGADSGGLHFVQDESPKSACTGIRTGGSDNCVPYTQGSRVTIHNYYDSQNRRVVRIDSSESVGTAGLLPNITTVIFGLKNAQGVVNSSGSQRIYYFKIINKSSNTLVRDLIPVLDVNGVACMFDKVSKTFFYNAGTGNFIAGPAI